MTRDGPTRWCAVRCGAGPGSWLVLALRGRGGQKCRTKNRSKNNHKQSVYTNVHASLVKTSPGLAKRVRRQEKNADVEEERRRRAKVTKAAED